MADINSRYLSLAFNTRFKAPLVLFFFTGSITYIVIVALLAVLVVIVLFVLALCWRRRCKASNSQQLQTLQGTPETSSVAGSVATTDSGNLSNDIIIGS